MRHKLSLHISSLLKSRRQGFLSPDCQCIAYMDNQKLMISKRDDSKAREILNATTLPKGMAIGL